MIEPIKKSKLSDKVYDQLISLIFSGEWEPGDKLPSENELSQLFNVSRIPIREALFRLQTMGIISTEQGKGTYVVHTKAENLITTIAPYFSRDEKQIADIMEYRRMVEPECAYKLAKSHSDAALQRLEKLLLRPEDFPAMNDQFPKYDTEFHSQLIISCSNQFLISINSLVQNALSSYHKVTSISHDSLTCAMEHIEIFQAIKNGQAKDAADLMRKHINFSCG